jgi:hypothetical protein
MAGCIANQKPEACAVNMMDTPCVCEMEVSVKNHADALIFHTANCDAGVTI